MWDTHSKNADRLQDCLCPQFDVGFTALIEDLEQRGLLQETLVVAIGEFGRTPKINAAAGRDHWGNVFSFALAGAGISGGQVFGASDKNGGYPTVDPIRPHDLTATIFHLLGIDPSGMFHDLTNRPHPVTKGTTLTKLLGNEPATKERCQAGGDLAFVPPFDASLLVDSDFRSARPLLPAGKPSRDNGWRATPLANVAAPGSLEVRRESGKQSGAVIECRLADAKSEFPVGIRALLAQEIRNARGGRYTFTVHAAGSGSSPEFFAQVFQRNFVCRLMLFRYATAAKDPSAVQVLASEAFTPSFNPDGRPQPFTISAFLGSLTPGANFAIGNGLGVAIVVERSTPGVITAAAVGQGSAQLHIERVSLEFDPRKRDDAVVS